MTAPRARNPTVDIATPLGAIVQLFASADADPVAGAVGPKFFFPNRGVVLEGVDRIPTSLKGLASVGRADRH